MVQAANVITSVNKKKRKTNISKNKKKSWKKHSDITDVELFLEQQEEEDRTTGCLGEKPTDELFDLDLGLFEASDDEEENETESLKSKVKKSGKKSVPMKLEYTVDAKTGLKSTDRPKKDKLIHRHRLLAGLPSAKSPYKGVSRFRKETTLEYKETAMRKSLEDHPIQLQKAQVKKLKSLVTSTKSKKLKRMNKKKNFNSNLWEEKTVTPEHHFIRNELHHTAHCMNTEQVNNRVSKIHPNKIPACVIPNAGLSYNPDFDDHQKLLRKAFKEEKRTLFVNKHQNSAVNENFPEGAFQVSTSELICDMNSETRSTPAPVHVENKLDPEDIAPPKKPTERKTHSQRLKEIRYQDLLRSQRLDKISKKYQREINRFKIKEVYEELDEVESKLEDRKNFNEKRAKAAEHKPPRFYKEKPMEVSFSNELHGSLRKITPSSNVLMNRLEHVFRRGLMPSHTIARRYKNILHGSSTKRVKGKPVEPFTIEDFPKDTVKAQRLNKLGKTRPARRNK